MPSSPPDPNRDRRPQTRPSKPSLEPSPAVVATTSPPRPPGNHQPHILTRRFLGPIPDRVTSSAEVEERRRDFLDLRRKAIDKWKREIRDDDSSLHSVADAQSEDGRLRRAVSKIRIKRRNKHGMEIEEDLDLDETGIQLGGKAKIGKEVWVGESFDIGQEFMSTAADTHTPELDEAEQESSQASASTIKPKPISRPSTTSQATGETFVTARTAFSPSQSSLAIDTQSTGQIPNPSPSLHGSQNAQLRSPHTHHSASSSTQPLIDSSELSDSPPGSSKKGKEPARSVRTNISLPNRLKSALRYSRPNLRGSSSAVIGDDEEQADPREGQQKAKTVQFPADYASVMPSLARSGDSEPAKPEHVLEREGAEAEGTSAGAVEEVLGENEWLPEERKVGEVILRDRMLVRVGYHRENNITVFDETAQRRNPCQRLDVFEEYIVVWRKGQVEFYQDWKVPLRERMVGTKRLCFVIPLLPHRTSISVFNPDDLTLALTTSVEKLHLEIERLLRISDTSKVSVLKDRIKQSSQVQWLQGRRKGTQIFLFKLSERSRALDWYWELFRDLGGELPDRFDIFAPSLSTHVRFRVPQGEEADETALFNRYNRDRVIKTCWEALNKDNSIDELLKERENEKREEIDLELVWKGVDGALDWVAYGSTVEGLKRPWAMLAGLARVQANGRELQLRPAKHQPKSLKLEDGTWLDEPAGVEGYLVRHRPASGTKESIYVTIHDGCIFMTTMREAKPPLLPQAEGSIPSDIFPDVHRQFLQNEHKRMATTIQRSAGCLDLRDITSVKFEQGAESNDGQGEGTGTVFNVHLAHGGVMIQLEAHSEQVAKEWVERLNDLRGFWMRKHRVEARMRMDAMELAQKGDILTGAATEASDDFLSSIWDWCTVKGCRSICLSGRMYMRKSTWRKFRSKYMVLTEGSLVSFKITGKNAFHKRKKTYPLFGAYVYSGLLAHEEIHEPSNRQAPFTSEYRVYQDGLQSSDGPEDTTFCVRLAIPGSSWTAKTVNPWNLGDDEDYTPMPLSKSPQGLLIFRARCKLERDRWVWAINAEMERQARSHLRQEKTLREYGNVPEKW
ncbi:hypothetical protein B9479_000662 [Cryptococcus floricola]|uniref:PH domain-containing protein n=1 Tax=Cryptococcus floricola TaxID=2591691 RepID=A0A5D3B3W8_9TREE|nr:hypothetical protein B9479_000662 [Cryptococcus floricola]